VIRRSRQAKEKDDEHGSESGLRLRKCVSLRELQLQPGLPLRSLRLRHLRLLKPVHAECTNALGDDPGGVLLSVGSGAATAHDPLP
jgi:hypothetical protein